MLTHVTFQAEFVGFWILKLLQGRRIFFCNMWKIFKCLHQATGTPCVLCSIMLKVENKAMLLGSSFRSRMWLGLTSIKSRGRLQSQSLIFIKALPLRSLSLNNPWEMETTFMTMVWSSPVSDRLLFLLPNNACDSRQPWAPWWLMSWSLLFLFAILLNHCPFSHAKFIFEYFSCLCWIGH